MDIESVYSKRENDDVWQKQTKVISTKVSVDNYNRFNILAEYLYKNGLIESHTPSALLRANIDYLLLKYHDELEDYCANSTMNSSILALQSSSLSPQEPEEQSEPDNAENFVGHLKMFKLYKKIYYVSILLIYP